uniref:Uncharacterized protein n=1 Tax=Aegilops tauschii subsp. strangulata TaxID=200361 RepID=A0A453AUW2_AEGTS
VASLLARARCPASNARYARRGSWHSCCCAAASRRSTPAARRSGQRRRRAGLVTAGRPGSARSSPRPPRPRPPAATARPPRSTRCCVARRGPRPRRATTVGPTAPLFPAPPGPRPSRPPSRGSSSISGSWLSSPSPDRWRAPSSASSIQGCVYIKEAYCVYWTSCAKGVHTGQMVLKVVEAIDVYLAGTVMLIFGMGLYGLFISNASNDLPSGSDRALQGSSLFGMFALKERPKWMKITSLDELKTKVGHVIVMILLVKMFERSKMVKITTGLDLLSYSVCIFLSSASLYILHNLHRPEHEESVMPHL